MDESVERVTPYVSLLSLRVLLRRQPSQAMKPQQSRPARPAHHPRRPHSRLWVCRCSVKLSTEEAPAQCQGHDSQARRVVPATTQGLVTHFTHLFCWTPPAQVNRSQHTQAILAVPCFTCSSFLAQHLPHPSSPQQQQTSKAPCWHLRTHRWRSQRAWAQGEWLAAANGPG
jgi:hypothetical protein